jgi:transposase-like protein
MKRSSAPRRDFAAMQERRRRAARLFAAGKRSQAEIARELDISRQSVSRWFEAWRQDKPNWIRGAHFTRTHRKAGAPSSGLFCNLCNRTFCLLL